MDTLFEFIDNWKHFFELIFFLYFLMSPFLPRLFTVHWLSSIFCRRGRSLWAIVTWSFLNIHQPKSSNTLFTIFKPFHYFIELGIHIYFQVFTHFLKWCWDLFLIKKYFHKHINFFHKTNNCLLYDLLLPFQFCYYKVFEWFKLFLDVRESVGHWLMIERKGSFELWCLFIIFSWFLRGDGDYFEMV